MQPLKAACRKIGRWKGQGADNMQYCRQETLKGGYGMRMGEAVRLNLPATPSCILFKPLGPGLVACLLRVAQQNGL